VNTKRVENKVPAIRFEGFSGEWEENSLDDIAEVLDGDRGHNYPNGEDLQATGHTLFLSASNVTANGFKLGVTQYINEVKSNCMGNGKLVLDDVVLTSRGSVGHIAWYNESVKQKVPFARINSGMLIIRSKNHIEPSIVAQFLKSPVGKKKIDLISFGSAQPQLTKISVSAYTVTIPSEKTEQTKIGNYFQQLDTLIAQHQKKHDKLLNLKKALLEKLFPKQGATEPEIRFKGFSGEWEDKVLGDCFTNIPSNTLSRADMNYEIGLAKNIHYGDVLIKFGEILDVEQETLPFITNSILAVKLKSGKLQNGDVIIADAAEDETVGKCTEVSNIKEQTVFAGLHTIAIRPVLPFASQYLGYYLNSSAYHDQLLSLMQGTKVLSISKTTIKTTEIIFPKNSQEQAKIGNLFKQLDTLLAQHQTQLKKLNNIKQACLEKMFV